MNHGMPVGPARFVGVILAIIAFALCSAAEAKKKKKKKKGKLGVAVVHVLDTDSAPVGGVEVVLDIERSDGSHDRRLGLTGKDGDARFEDVRSDCKQVRATVRAETGEVEGKSRPCGALMEAFVVVPAVEPEAPPEPEPAPQPAVAEEVEFPDAAAVAEDPYAEPVPDAPAEPPAEPSPEPSPETGPFELRARAGVDACVELFYEPAEQQRTCEDTDAIGFGVEIDAAFHFEEWLLVGVLGGYRYFGSRVIPLDSTEEEPLKKTASNHTVMLGFELRLSWMLDSWVLALDGVPVGISHRVINLAKDRYSQNEFFTIVALSAGYRVGRASWFGVYVELYQPMPWVHSDIFQPGNISAGMMFGTRLAAPQRDDTADDDSGTADEGQQSESALDRRRQEGY
jgi:hypothetical protein